VSFPFQAVLFDLDGVLADSELLSNRVWVQLLADHGLTLTHDDFMTRSVGLSLAALYAGLERDFSWRRPETFDASSSAALTAAFGSVEAVPGARETLQSLRQAGIPFAVASNSRRDWLDLKLRAAGLADLVQNSFDPSQVGGRGKPLPDLYQHAAAALGADIRHSLVIEDSVTGVQAGVAAGATVWGLLAGEHVSPPLGGQLLAAGAAQVFGSYAEVRSALGLETLSAPPSGR
jgi:HAD superfamily hydrolase (TIGR01509 family)